METDILQRWHKEKPYHGLSELSVTAAAVWHVLRCRMTAHFPRVLNFIDIIYKAAPDLLHYRHYAKLSLGLRAKIILDLIGQEGPNNETWRVFQLHFPKCPSDVTSHMTLRDLQKVQSADFSFRTMVKRLFEDDEFRKSYMKEQVALDYGEAFVAVLEKLMRELLVRLSTALSENKRQELQLALESSTLLSGSEFTISAASVAVSSSKT
ncbi:TERF1-interacting nuclear factor 2 [Bombina bombina]|uniref:TERF1-interacting nuclear factor 2 n=1 Tax=Bombina bombina TaxID=8345 RepID=UPI00235AB8EE|nr:TERF1-interacting nuclear factor 2 [Bombina bombina]